MSPPLWAAGSSVQLPRSKKAGSEFSGQATSLSRCYTTEPTTSRERQYWSSDLITVVERQKLVCTENNWGIMRANTPTHSRTGASQLARSSGAPCPAPSHPQPLLLYQSDLQSRGRARSLVGLHLNLSAALVTQDGQAHRRLCPIDLWEEASCPGVLGKGEKPKAVRTRSGWPGSRWWC